MWMLAESEPRLIRGIGISESYQTEEKDLIFMETNPSKYSFDVPCGVSMLFIPQAPRGKGELCGTKPVLSFGEEMEVMHEKKQFYSGGRGW